MLVAQAYKSSRIFAGDIAGAEELGNPDSANGAAYVPDEAAKKIENVGSVTATPGYCSEVITLFIGTELDTGDANPDLNEYVSTVKIPLAEALQMADSGEIEDSKTLVLLYKASRRLGI